MMIDGHMIEGAQNIFFAQLADPNTTHFSADARSIPVSSPQETTS